MLKYFKISARIYYITFLVGVFTLRIFIDIITNDLVLVALISWAISQVAKVVTYFITYKTFLLSRAISDGGMPSAHAATIASAVTVCGCIGEFTGFSTHLFGLAGIFLVVVIRDAVGVRRDTGKNAKKIVEIANKINKDLPDEEKIDTSNLKLIAGHSVPELIAGVIVGVVVGVLYVIIKY